MKNKVKGLSDICSFTTFFNYFNSCFNDCLCVGSERMLERDLNFKHMALSL